MGNAQMYFSLARNYFKRNNPIEAVALGMVQQIYGLLTLNSRMKLLKYRRMLELQKLDRIERTLNEFNPYEHTGKKINRTY